MLSAFGLAFVLVLLVELPDKTLVATLVLSTRYRPRPVLLGVAAAFAVQCVIAVTAGGLLHLLPHRVLEVAVAAMFLAGALLLAREARETADAPELASERQALPAARIALTSFGVLFAAEWGDASQIASAGLAARLGQPVAVGLGAWLALVVVAAVAVVAGRFVVRRIPVHRLQLAAAVVFAVLAVVALVAAARG